MFILSVELSAEIWAITLPVDYLKGRHRIKLYTVIIDHCVINVSYLQIRHF